MTATVQASSTDPDTGRLLLHCEAWSVDGGFSAGPAVLAITSCGFAALVPLLAACAGLDLRGVDVDEALLAVGYDPPPPEYVAVSSILLLVEYCYCLNEFACVSTGPVYSMNLRWLCILLT